MKNALPLLALAVAASAAAQTRAPELPELAQLLRLAKESTAPAMMAQAVATPPQRAAQERL